MMEPMPQDFRSVCDALLECAGGALSLVSAAARLHVSREALHRRILNGGVLGMMHGGELVLPALQFTEDGQGLTTIVPGIAEVTRLFQEAKAGPWMALQFLVDHDPNLRTTPIEALRTDRRRAVIEAARAHLHLDEG